MHNQIDISPLLVSLIERSPEPVKETTGLDQSPCNEYWRRKIFVLREIASFKIV